MKEANLQFESSACSGNSQPVDNLAETFTQYVTPVLTEYIGSASEKSPTFKYWLMLLHAIQLILHNIKAEREGNWQLHLYTISKMLPYFFITNRTNYSRWAPVYLLDMLELPPEVQQHFENGEFTIRQVSGRYNGIWSDMAVEKTVIKDSKGSGGIANIAGQKSALIRWSLSRHVVADFASTMRVRSGIKSEADHMHGQTQKAAMKRDVEHVRTLINHLTERMTNPFDISLHPECLINISTGMHVSPEIQKSLLTAIETGDKNLRSFVNNAFSTDGKSSFYSPLSRSNLKTFADMSKKTPFRFVQETLCTFMLTQSLCFEEP